VQPANQGSAAAENGAGAADPIQRLEQVHAATGLFVRLVPKEGFDLDTPVSAP
jgi:hypothetical protein